MSRLRGLRDASEEAQLDEYERLMAEADEIIAAIRGTFPGAKVSKRERKQPTLLIDLDRWVDAHGGAK